MSGVLGDLSQLPMNIGLDAVPDTIQNGASTGPVMVRAWSHSFQKNNHRMAPMESPMMATLPLFSINPYLLGDAPRPPMFPPIFLRHLCIFPLIVASPRWSALAAPIPESDDHVT